MIRFVREGKTIHLSNNHVSCVLQVCGGKLLQVYFGPHLKTWLPLPDMPAYRRAFATEHEGYSRPFDELPFAFPESGQGDFREDAISLTGEYDFHDFKVKDVRIENRLLTPSGMPGITGEGKTLIVTLRSSVSDLELDLHYGMNESFSGVFRFQKLRNLSQQPVRIRKLASASLELPAKPWKLATLCGTHLKEGSRQVTGLPFGKIVLDSRRGSSSSQHPPFLTLSDGEPEWDQGEIVGCVLLYSGNHAEIIEKDYYSQIRLIAGVHPDHLDWILNPDESFDTPQCILSCTERGLNGMAQNFHNLFLDHLFRKGEAPVLVNSWESFYYDTTENKLLSLAKNAEKLDMDLLVIDDGWFRMDNSSRAPIGDWEVNRNKLPGSLESVCRHIKQTGLKTGLWFEPEAVSGNSRLYREHPDWILHLPYLSPVEGRHEFLLNLGLREVQNHIIHMLDAYLASGWIDYIKWDMNRPLTDIRKSEDSHRYILGLYRILQHLKDRYPDVIIEGCSSGGNRLDAGILSYVNQNWASDNTDPFDRVEIQSGLSLFLPPSKLTAHVSASPNHQTGRISRIEDRYEITRFFNPGYELDLEKMSKEEQEKVKAQVKEIHQEQEWMKEAVFFQGDRYWARTDPSRTRAEVLVFQKHFAPQEARMPVCLPFLNDESIYEVKPDSIRMTGEQIRRCGLMVPAAGHDFQVRRISLTAAE